MAVSNYAISTWSVISSSSAASGDMSITTFTGLWGEKATVVLYPHPELRKYVGTMTIEGEPTVDITKVEFSENSDILITLPDGKTKRLSFEHAH